MSVRTRVKALMTKGNKHYSNIIIPSKCTVVCINFVFVHV